MSEIDIKQLIKEYKEEAEAMKNVAKISSSPVNKAKHNTASEYCIRFAQELESIYRMYRKY